MRLTILAMAAALLLIPSAPMSAATGMQKLQTTDFSAAKKKRAKKAKAPKVEYMRAVPVK